VGLASIPDPRKLELGMFNIIIVIIINIILNKFEKNIITIKKNHKFDLKACQTHLNLGQACLILLLIL
jgi:hypothetical protein